MSAVIIEGMFNMVDHFRPRKPARNRDEELTVAADINTLGKIEAWASARRQILENTAIPLDPRVRKMANEIDDTIHGHPKGGPA